MSYCTCDEHGDNPKCLRHGDGTQWAAEQLAKDVLRQKAERVGEELARLRARLAEVEAERDGADASVNAWKKLSRELDYATDMICGLLAEVEAREKAKDERIAKLTEAASRAHTLISVNNADAELNWIDDVREILFGVLRTTSPSQPVKVAEEKCDHQKSDYHAMSMCPKCCPPAEKLTGTGEER